MELVTPLYVSNQAVIGTIGGRQKTSSRKTYIPSMFFLCGHQPESDSQSFHSFYLVAILHLGAGHRHSEGCVWKSLAV